MKTLSERALEVVAKWSRETGILSPDGTAYWSLHKAIYETMREVCDDTDASTKSLIMKEMAEKLGVPCVEVGMSTMKPEGVMGIPMYDSSTPTFKWETKTKLPESSFVAQSSPGYVEIKTVNEHYFIDNKGRKHGEYMHWHANGQLLENCHYVNDLLHGESKSWYPDGRLFSWAWYVKGKKVRDFPLTSTQNNGNMQSYK